ncbi:MAG: hypothetical protein VKJ24_00680 [Synechococcales bacterium]|nr:hypothetical protein [Synechococcales bacterium]
MAQYTNDRAYSVRSGSAARMIDIGGGKDDDPRSVGDHRDPVRLWVIGKPEHVQAMINNLHMRGVAEPHEWSRPNPWDAMTHGRSETIAPETQTQMLNLPPGAVMSVCTRYLP